MANNYTETSFIALFDNEASRDAALAALGVMEDAAASDTPPPHELAYLYERMDIADCGSIGFAVEPSADTGLWIYSDESVSVDQVIEALMYFAEHYQMVTPLSFTWSHHSQKLRLDEQGGGAAVITRGAAFTMDAAQWAADVINNLITCGKGK